MLNTMLKARDMSVYKCSKISGIPYSTLLDIVNGKTKMANCSLDTIYKLAITLEIPFEKFAYNILEPRLDFETFKSNVCHFVKNDEQLQFVVNTLQSGDIERYWEKGWYAESFYLLAMIDYLSRMNNLPLCNRYDNIRSQKLKEVLFPQDVMLTCALNNNDDAKEKAIAMSIPEFLRFNIIETEVNNVW